MTAAVGVNLAQSLVRDIALLQIQESKTNPRRQAGETGILTGRSGRYVSCSPLL
jgi:hypothetical protein